MGVSKPVEDSESRVKIAKYLLKHGSDIWAKDSTSSLNSLGYCLTRSCFKVAEIILDSITKENDRRAYVNEFIGHYTPLGVACMRDNVSVDFIKKVQYGKIHITKISTNKSFSVA